MSTPGDRLREWALPRKWSIIGGLSLLLVALLLFGLTTDDWVSVAGGLVGLLLAGAGVAIIVMYPAVWEPGNRLRSFVVWVAAGTVLIAIIVAVVFVLT
jgi:uncharacterized membrane protein